MYYSHNIYSKNIFYRSHNMVSRTFQLFIYIQLVRTHVRQTFNSWLSQTYNSCYNKNMYYNIIHTIFSATIIFTTTIIWYLQPFIATNKNMYHILIISYINMFMFYGYNLCFMVIIWFPEWRDEAKFNSLSHTNAKINF